MKRREALKYSGFLTAAGLSAGTISAILTACGPTQPMASDVDGWNVDQIEQLKSISNVIMPTTDTPGALEAGIADDMAMHVANNFSLEDQKAFMTGLTNLDERSQTMFSNKFSNLAVADQEAVLNAIADEGGEPNFFEVVKGMTVYLFFTSEVGATQVLNHLPIPGEYEPCIDYAEVGATWAL